MMYSKLRLRGAYLAAALASINWGSSSAGVNAQCSDYTTFSQTPQGNNSAGPLALPFMRPSPACRTFNNSAVEQVIEDMKARLKDPDIARLFENTFPNTLDTTVKYFNATENIAFIITGDITAQWLRDTGNQSRTQARYISDYPYCGAFQPPPESGLAPTVNGYATGVTVNPPVDNNTVYECKVGQMRIFSNDKGLLITLLRLTAISQIFRVIDEQSQASWDADFNFISYYNWTGGNGALSPAVNNAGNGEPKGYSGLVGTHHRPSDDLSTFECSGVLLPAFLTPANAMLSVELTNLADMMDSVGEFANISTLARAASARIESAIWKTTLDNDVFAYETNGFGSRYIMDDANVPSLLSLPYLGFLNKTHPAYVATRKVLLSRQNPYYAKGVNFSGIGGPHEDAWHIWPMSLISSIYGTDDDDEITTALYMIANNTLGLGLIHESINIYNQSDYTRPWFAWVNSYFAEMLLDLAERKPGLIFNTNESYVIGK
ncbi:hypothetical protein EW145_g2291 [Phellinidium pouzarii]|uniref:Glycoside hydrolase family 125 protein n=1 Tax=Phellinidium pouzarii TaxID=167371 RepID=A0A4V3XDA7_9AGAM|nr:hypothetical protein EW145_g2291 [Phellinidium pouzarii]